MSLHPAVHCRQCDSIFKSRFGSMTKRVKITSGVVGPFPPGLISPGQSPINIQKKRNKGKKKKKKKKKSNKAKSMAKGLPCAKMLVRSGLRCSCHFVYTEKCPARARNRLLCAKMSVRSGLRCSCHYVYAEKCPAQSNYEMLS